MTDQRTAILTAKAKAAEYLGQWQTNLEEIEREDYGSRDSWSITLSFPLDAPHTAHGLGFVSPLQYKRFLIDVETGEFMAMKIRELLS